MSLAFSLTSFSISCKADLLVMDSCSFYLLENVFMLPSLLKDSFAGYKILSVLGLLTVFCYPLFLTRSQLFILLGFPYPRLVTSLLLLSRFSVFQIFDYMSECGFLCVYPHWSLSGVLDVYISVLHHIYPFLSLPLLVFLMVAYIFWRFCSFFFILYSFCSSDCIISNSLSSISLILSSDNSDLLLSPSSEFFILVIVLFESRIFEKM